MPVNRRQNGNRTVIRWRSVLVRGHEMRVAITHLLPAQTIPGTTLPGARCASEWFALITRGTGVLIEMDSVHNLDIPSEKDFLERSRTASVEWCDIGMGVGCRLDIKRCMGRDCTPFLVPATSVF